MGNEIEGPSAQNAVPEGVWEDLVSMKTPSYLCSNRFEEHEPGPELIGWELGGARVSVRPCRRCGLMYWEKTKVSEEEEDAQRDR